MKKISFFGETMGLYPIKTRLKQAMIVFFGEEDVPKVKFDISSLGNLKPSVGIPLWRGKQLIKNKVIISCLFNHTQTPVEEGWSVKKTQIRDFRNKTLTYNSHNGTDLAIPIGTEVLTAAPGEVVSIKSEFNRGGLKIIIDHGNGLMSCSVHLARALVKVGDILKRGQLIAISGYSGFDGFITFPFGIPHIHFNVWQNGKAVDPFGINGETSIWKSGNLPLPFMGEVDHEEFIPSIFDSQKIEEAIKSCKTKKVRDRLMAIPDLKLRAAETIIEMNYYPTRFTKSVNLYGKEYQRKQMLDLPVSKENFNGVIFMDEMNYP